MTPDRRCPARSRLTDEQCIRPAGHDGRHERQASQLNQFEEPEQLWSVPSADQPFTLEELLAHLHDLIMLCRVEGYGNMADALTVVRARIVLEPSAFQRDSARRRELPPGT